MPVRSLALALALALALSAAAAALAQTPPASPDASAPSPAVREAVRKACAADIKTYCADLQPGQALRQCVRDNFAKLSPDCRTALKSMRSQREQH